MKSFLLSLLLGLTALTANAAILGAPYMPEVDRRFDAIEQGAKIKQGVYPQGSVDGVAIKHYAKATYDFAKSGGAVGTIDLGIGLPANAIITRSYVYSITAPTGSVGATLAFQCQNASDVLAATGFASFGAAGASIDGASTGAASAFKYLTAACNIKAVIATAALTAGKLAVYVEYSIHQ